MVQAPSVQLSSDPTKPQGWQDGGGVAIVMRVEVPSGEPEGVSACPDTHTDRHTPTQTPPPPRWAAATSTTHTPLLGEADPRARSQARPRRLSQYGTTSQKPRGSQQPPPHRDSFSQAELSSHEAVSIDFSKLPLRVSALAAGHAWIIRCACKWQLAHQHQTFKHMSTDCFSDPRWPSSLVQARF